ncbi:hypothetical protein L1887_18695 [Cichorium endivia]|nr:hypothetical protein L1887_18695 [Cichorium endivia]
MDSKFSDDMTMEILSRTSLNTLDALRCTSKQFGTLTYDPYFLNLYKQNNKIVSGFLIIRFSKPRPDNKYVEYITYRCEIFDSRTWAWTQDRIRLPSYFSPYDKHPIIITRGSIYMLLWNKEVFKFDAYSEKWTTFSSPTQTLIYDLHVPDAARKLVKYQGKLGFALHTPSLRSWEIWVLTVDQSWEQLQVVDMKEVRLNSLEAIYDSNTRVAWEEQTTLVFYKIKGDDRISELQMYQGGYYPCRTFAFRSDFEPADLRGR